MQTRKTPVNPLLVFLLPALGVIVLFCLSADVAIENYWMVRAFEVDESGVLDDIQVMFHKGVWQPITYVYGTAHTYIALSILKLLALFKVVLFSDVTLVSRAINGLSLLGVGFLFLRHQSSRIGAKWSFLFLVSYFFTGVCSRYAVNSKPEHLQALFIVASLFAFSAFLKGHKDRLLFLAALLCGFAFATKYAGLLLISFLALMVMLDIVSSLKTSEFIRTCLRRFTVMACGFVLGVFVLGPYLIINYEVVQFIFQAQAGVMKTGYLFMTAKWYSWFGKIFSRDVFWWVLSIGLVPGGLVIACRWHAWRKEWLRKSLFALWILFFLIYLLVLVREQPPRYFLVVLPFLYHLLFSSLNVLDEELCEKQLHRVRQVLFLASVLAVIFVAGSSWHFTQMMQERASAPRLAAGQWLTENVDHTQLVASDLYTYVPPEFNKHYHQIYLTAYDVMRVSPDYLVVSKTVMSRYLDAAKGTLYFEGADSYMRHYYLYSRLNQDVFPGYKMVRDFDEVRIYRKT